MTLYNMQLKQPLQGRNCHNRELNARQKTSPFHIHQQSWCVLATIHPSVHGIVRKHRLITSHFSPPDRPTIGMKTGILGLHKVISFVMTCCSTTVYCLRLLQA